MKQAICIALALACGAVWAASTPANALLVLSKTDTTLSIVDPSTLKVVAKMPSGPDPHEVVASADASPPMSQPRAAKHDHRIDPRRSDV